MKKISLAITLLLTNIAYADEMAIKQEGVKYIKMLGKELKTNLKAHLKADPTGIQAMAFCTAKAEEITDEINEKLPKYAKVRRTALKTRNEKNAPDDVDTMIMKAYEKKAQEKKLKPTDIEMVESDGTYRIYKPLMIHKACLKCHGSSENVSEDIKMVLSKVYPKDKAMNFKEGDFRGVVVTHIKK